MLEKAFIQIYRVDQRLYEDVEDIDAGSFKHVEPQVGQTRNITTVSRVRWPISANTTNNS